MNAGNDSMLILFFKVLISFLVISGTEGLSCYDCPSTNHTECNITSKGKTAKCTLNKPQCYTIAYNGTMNLALVQRGCWDEVKALPYKDPGLACGANFIPYNNDHARVCLCNKDNCNDWGSGASNLVITFATGQLIMLGSIVTASFWIL